MSTDRKNAICRREFIGSATAAAMAFTIVPSHVFGKDAPSNKLNIAGVGVGGRGAGDLRSVGGENIVALCDVDSKRAAGTVKKFPRAKVYSDFRVMLDKQKNIDAVVVATPDHTHAVATMMAIKMGKHVYCEKPLTHSLHEARMITEAAREHEVATQMGNQGHSSEQIRMVCEWVWDGAIGQVREVHAWSNRPSGGYAFPVAMKRPKEEPPVPSTLNWDLWLGPVPYRPYHPAYVPAMWRGWVDFGTGALGDMGCHILDPAFWALKLGYPTSVEACTTHYDPEVSAETYPVASIVRYEFPARGDMPPVELTWFDGGMLPPRPKDLERGRKLGGNGAIFIGDKGKIIHGSHGAGGARIFPETKMKAYGRPPRMIERSKGHYQDWIEACKGGKAASSNFDYGGALTEMVLLGVLAMRVKNKRLEWDGEKMRVTNNDEANEYINPPYRPGWSL
jgi:predicted dehydrogenase